MTKNWTKLLSMHHLLTLNFEIIEVYLLNPDSQNEYFKNHVLLENQPVIFEMVQGCQVLFPMIMLTYLIYYFHLDVNFLLKL